MADTYRVKRKIRIDAPASAVYERIIDFHRWPAWSPYEELDPGMDRTYAGSESGLGAVYEWSGNLSRSATLQDLSCTNRDDDDCRWDEEQELPKLAALLQLRVLATTQWRPEPGQFAPALNP